MRSTEENRDRVTKYLHSMQIKAEGATPGRMKNSLKMTDEEFANVLQTMIEAGEIEMLPPDYDGGRGRRSPIIFHTKFLRGPDPSNIKEMIDTNFIPKPTDQPNPLLEEERHRRGRVGTFKPVTGIEAVEEAMLRVGSLFERSRAMGFTRDEYFDFCTPNVPLPVVEFVFRRLTSPIYAEHHMIGGLMRADSKFMVRHAGEARKNRGTPDQQAFFTVADKFISGMPEKHDEDLDVLATVEDFGGPRQLIPSEHGVKDYVVNDDPLFERQEKLQLDFDLSIDRDHPMLFAYGITSHDWFSDTVEAELMEMANHPPRIDAVLARLESTEDTDS